MTWFAIAAIVASVGLVSGQESLSKDQAFKVLKDAAQTEVSIFSATGQGYGDLAEIARSSGWTDRLSDA